MKSKCGDDEESEQLKALASVFKAVLLSGLVQGEKARQSRVGPVRPVD